MSLRYIIGEVLRGIALAGNEFSPVNPHNEIVPFPDRFGLYLVQWTDAFELRRLEVHWSRTPTLGVAQDDDICTFHFLNLTAGAPDASWVEADYAAVEQAVDVFWDAIGGNYDAETRLTEYIWRADGPAYKPFGSSLSPVLRATARSTTGTAGIAAMLPPQVACSVTEVTDAKYTAFGVGVPGSAPGTGRTQVRNRWGRFYLPAMITGALDDGRFAPGTCAQVSGAVQAMYNTLVAADLIPVMYSPTTGHAWSITQVHVDDIADVVRSRRYVTPLSRHSNDIDQP